MTEWALRACQIAPGRWEAIAEWGPLRLEGRGPTRDAAIRALRAEVDAWERLRAEVEA